MTRPFVLWLSALSVSSVLAQTPLTYPQSYKSNNLVHSNFFGVSIELSIINTLIGDNVSTIPPQIENYFSNIQARAGMPVRMRIGGNSMDDSVYDPAQKEMITYPTQAANINDQPVKYGPVLYDVLHEVASRVNGAQYLIGLSLILHTNNSEDLIASTVESKLGTYLDGFLLGNEPDLYGRHGKRDANYSQTDYFAEFAQVSNQLNSSSLYGDTLKTPLIGGPTICCVWDLADLLKQGYLAEFGKELKYLNLQHYPQDNCGGPLKYPIDYYLRHYEVISLAQWQIAGVNAAHAANIPITMGEFNSASCGGIPGISDTFGATMWAMDYALQLASVGYTAAYIHTRERGITYNLFDPPASNDTSKDWTTNPSYYSLLPVAEALSKEGSYVTDLNINNNSNTSVVAGYGVYDANGKPSNIVIFNYAEAGHSSATFSIPANGKHTLLVRTLTAATLLEKRNISWAGKTLDGVGNGLMVDSNYAPDQQVPCDNGCTVTVPSPGAAVVFFDASTASAEPTPQPNPTTGAKQGSKNAGLSQTTASLRTVLSWTSVALLLSCFCAL